jgi:signal transduction histidine kinase
MTVSQELRKPLTGVRAIAQLVAADEELMSQPRMTDLHALLVGELDDMSAVVEDLLATSRLDAGALDYAIEPIQVRDEVRALLGSLNHRGASVYLAMDEGVVNADRRRLRQIVRNLLTNALKYGGPNIEIKGQAEDDSYTLLVIDDGHGVPGAVEDTLFNRFVDSREGSQNVGLGLSIVMALAVGMGGTAFHQREDGLTRFGIRLPNAGPITGDEQPEEATMVPVAQATS